MRSFHHTAASEIACAPAGTDMSFYQDGEYELIGALRECEVCACVIDGCCCLCMCAWFVLYVYLQAWKHVVFSGAPSALWAANLWGPTRARPF